MLVRLKSTFAFPHSLGDWVPYVAVFVRLLDPAANLSYLILALYALRGRTQAIQALALSWFFVMINPAIAPDLAFGEIGRYTVLFASVLSVARRKVPNAGRYDGNFMSLTIILGLFFIVHSLLFSAMPDVSILKAVSWTVAMTTLIAAWSGLTPDQSSMLQGWLIDFLIIILLISLPFVAISSVGYKVSGSGFQGILNHPQAFGLSMALLGTLIFGWLLAQKNPPISAIILVLICFGMIFISQARTAGFGLVLGVSVSVISVLLLSGKSFNSLAPSLRSLKFQMLIFFGFFIAVAMSTSLDGEISKFINKGSEMRDGDIIEAYDESRGLLIDNMVENIEKQPFAGIGFGIASDPYYRYVWRDPIFGLPVKAPVEKGVMPLAVLEEVGIMGFILVGIWIIALLRRAAARGLAALSVVIVVLFLNMGESVLFSFGGFGMLTMILLAWASAKPKKQPVFTYA